MKLFKKKEEKSKKLKILTGLFGLMAGLFALLYPKRKEIEKTVKKVVEKEEEEIESLNKKIKRHFKDFFVPHEDNEHKPLSIRPKSLLFYIILLVAVKLVVTGFLFVVYPSPAELANIVTAKLIELVNIDRAENGIEKLEVDSVLSQSALAKAQDMIDKGYFSHNSPDGRKPWQWIDRAEYDYVYAGENLAMGFISAESIHAAFMKSPTHQRNILNPKYKDIGVAVVSGQINGKQTDILVEFFGTQRSEVSTLAKASGIIVEKKEPKIKPETTETEAVAGEEVEIPSQSQSQQPQVSPEYSAGEGVIIVSVEPKTSKTLVDLIIEYSNIFFLAFLFFVLIALILNVFIQVRVQHPKLILQTIAVAALIIAMILVKFHFVEKIAPQLLIL